MIGKGGREEAKVRLAGSGPPFLLHQEVVSSVFPGCGTHRRASRCTSLFSVVTRRGSISWQMGLLVDFLLCRRVYILFLGKEEMLNAYEYLVSFLSLPSLASTSLLVG